MAGGGLRFGMALMIELERLLRAQGFGSRAECRALVRAGRVCVGGTLCDDPLAQFEAEGLGFSVDGGEWTYRKLVYLALNKPPGHECSRHPVHHPSVYSLLPEPLVRRGVQTVGRLDQDTTGLLLLTDDGSFIHRCTSPRRSVPKTYRVTTRHAVDDRQVAVLLNGVQLHDNPQPVAAAACLRVEQRCLQLTVTQGRYHLVRRMIAAAGNRVEALHRLSIGGLGLPESLSRGEWMYVDSPEEALISSGAGTLGCSTGVPDVLEGQS